MTDEWLQFVGGNHREEARLLVKGFSDVRNKFSFPRYAWHNPNREREHPRLLLLHAAAVIFVVAFTLVDNLIWGLGVEVYLDEPPVLILPGDRNSKEVRLERLYRTVFAEGAPTLWLRLEGGEFKGALSPAEFGQPDSNFRHRQSVGKKVGAWLAKAFRRREGVVFQIE